MNISYYDNMASTFQLVYARVDQIVTTAVTISTGNTAQWVTANITLNMMDLRNKLNGGDFKLLWVSGADTIIGFIEFHILDYGECVIPTDQTFVNPFSLQCN